MQLCGSQSSLARRHPYRGHGVDEREEFVRVVDIGGRHRFGERQALGVYEKMMLATRLRFIRRAWAREGPLFDAQTDEESMEAREKSTLPRSPNSSSSRS